MIGGYVKAKDLHTGDHFRLLDGRIALLEDVDIENTDIFIVYNLEVEDWHTYYVGELSVLVHNMCASDAAAKKPKESVSSSGKKNGGRTSGTSSKRKFENWLNKGNADNKVYFGIKNGKAKYTGITKQSVEARLSQHNKSGKNFARLEIQYDNLTRNQARAIEQYFIENGPNELNKINSIGQKNEHYMDALNWAKQYLGK